jgi:hypothetical protein
MSEIEKLKAHGASYPDSVCPDSIERLASVLLQMARSLDNSPVAPNGNLGPAKDPSILTTPTQLERYNKCVDGVFIKKKPDGTLDDHEFHEVVGIMPQFQGINPDEFIARFSVQVFEDFLRHADGTIVSADRTGEKRKKITRAYFCDCSQFVENFIPVIVANDRSYQQISL